VILLSESFISQGASHESEERSSPHFVGLQKIEQQNTGESIGYDVTNRNIASLQCPIFTPMTYGHERMKKIFFDSGCSSALF